MAVCHGSHCCVYDGGVLLACALPVALYVFERHACCLWHEAPHDEHVWHAHHCEEHECAGR